jgi:DNA repair protein RadC
MPLLGAQARRRLLQVREAVGGGPDAAAALGLSRDQVKRARQGLDQLAALQGEHSTARAWSDSLDGPPALLEGLRRALPALRGQERWRFLRSIGTEVIIPDRRRQTLLTRLGLLRAPSAGNERGEQWADQHDLCLTIAGLVAEPLPAVDFVLGAFAGGEPGLPAGVALCTRVPECPRCPVNSMCEYFRHRRDEPVAPRSTMKSLPEEDRPREKLATRGAEALTDAELLAIVLRSGTGGGITALDLAARLLARFDSIGGLAKAGLGELCEVGGVGPAKAAEILAALEVGRRAASASPPRGEEWTSSEAIHRHVAPRMATLEHEEFRLLLLDTRMRLIREVTVSRGDLTGATVHPREIFKQAIRESAAAFIAVHNHPSGDPTPSFEDREITNQLAAAGDIVGIRLLDHLIIGTEGYTSFADNGWL